MKSLLLITLLAALVACSGCLTDGSSAVSTIGVTGGYSPDSGQWTAGVTITFKEAPSLETEEALKNAGAWRVSPLVFVLPQYEAARVEQALRAGKRNSVASIRYNGEVAVYFSPNGGCTEAIIREIDRATNCILVQAYNFSSVPIAQALAKASRRGVAVVEIQDKVAAGQKSFQGPILVRSGGSVFIDGRHAIAHNKIMLFDGATVITGSFNFSANAETRNAENLLIIRNDADLVASYTANWSNHLAHSVQYAP